MAEELLANGYKNNSIQSTSNASEDIFISNSNNRDYSNIKIPSRQTSTPVLAERGLSENDATHFRLRDGVTPTEYFTCYSCGLTFSGTSYLLQIYEHYSETVHNNYFGNCLYCQGKVHQYYRKRENRLCYYHDCLRWKRGDDC